MKNIKMFAIAALVAAVVMTSYSVSGTYAKYTTTATDTDSARVAKWGIGMTNEVDLFSDNYTDVVAADGSNVVAPGTQGSYTFEIEGAPETDYTLEVDVTGTDNIGQIVYTLDGTEYDSISALATAIDALYVPTQVYAANTDSESQHTIGWYWAFEGEEGTDTTDTGLGNAETAATVTLTVKITAIQVDGTPVTTTVAAGN